MPVFAVRHHPRSPVLRALDELEAEAAKKAQPAPPPKPAKVPAKAAKVPAKAAKKAKPTTKKPAKKGRK